MSDPVVYSGRDAGLSKAAYTRLESRTRREIAGMAQMLEHDTATRNEAYRYVAAKVQFATMEAFRLGKAVGWGVRHTPVILTPGEAQRATNLSRVQCGRLRSWLLAPGPLVKPGVQGIGPRLDMYGLSIHAAYQTGLTFGLLQAASDQKGMQILQDDPVWLWERSKDPGICSCRGCMAREARSRVQPYTLTELLTIGLPAQGHTPCLTRCRCRVRLIDAFGADILTRRAHHRAKSTAYHGVVDPTTAKTLSRINIVGSR